MIRSTRDAPAKHGALSVYAPADLSAEEMKRAGVTVLGEYRIYGVTWLLFSCDACGWIWGIHHWPKNKQAVLDQRKVNPYWICQWDRRKDDE